MGFTLFVRGVDYECLTLYLGTDESKFNNTRIGELKMNFKLNFNETIGFFDLAYNGIILEDDMMISDYSIPNNSCLFLVRYKDQWCRALFSTANLSPGFSFVDVSEDKNLKIIQFRNDAPNWRAAAPGLCFEDKCTNRSCDAYNQWVIINMGFGSFKIGMPEPVKKCPQCSSKLPSISKKCAFNNCYWKLNGVKLVGDDSERVKCDWKYVDKEYHLFDGEEDVHWIELILETKPVRLCFQNEEGVKTNKL